MSTPAVPAAAPRLLVSGESLLGLSRGTRDRTLEVAARFREPESLAVTLAKAVSSGADGVLVSPTQQLRLALAALKHPLPIFGLLPNVPEYVRDSSDLGLVGAALKRVRLARPATLTRLGITGVTHGLGVVRGDFASMVPLLLELEAAALDARDLRGIVVAAPITDLALAGKHRQFFAGVTEFIRRRFRVLAGFETHNLGHLLRGLREWGVKPDFVIGPVNPRGVLMKPTADEVLDELRQSTVPVLAKELRAMGTVSLEDGVRYARARGAHGLVPDLIDLGELAVDVRALSA